jgi:Transposase DDE domain group 1
MTHYTRFSSRASLCAVGMYMSQQKIWEAVEERVHIEQKVLKHKPTDKMLDAFMNILAGGCGLVEINTRVRPDGDLQRAFGRESCADQSTISDTFNACTPENVQQTRGVLQEIFGVHGQAYRHPYQQNLQVLDVDMSGMPAGCQAEEATKGYFARQKNRRGRQLGRVLATNYDEVVVDRLYSGTKQLNNSFQDLAIAAEEVLGLGQDQDKRQRTLIRVDGGGGKDADINWVLARNYHLLTKVNNWKRSVVLARSVVTWYPDPKTGDREVGWVTEPHSYARSTRQLAIRTPKKKGGWLYAVLVFTLSDEQLFWLARQPFHKEPTEKQILFAALYAYDLRSGGAETSNKGSKSGLGLTKRNKRSFAAQEMLVLLAQMAYNLLSWTRNHLAVHDPRLRSFGPLRIVRDLFQIPGTCRLDAQGRILEITLNDAHPFARLFVQALSSLLAQDDVLLNLGQI